LHKKIFSLFILLSVVTITLLLQSESSRRERSLLGVTIHKKAKAFQGYNLYNTRPDANIYLIDMEGRVVREWFVEPAKDWGVHYSALDPSGNLYVIKQNQRLLKLNWNGEILWNIGLGAHHDLDFDENGNVISFEMGRRKLTYNKEEFPAFIDSVTRISPEGKKEHLFDLYNALHPFFTPQLLEAGHALFTSSSRYNVPDILHANGLSIMKRRIEGFCEKGDFLFSLRDLNTLVLYRPIDKQVVWHWGAGVLDGQHFPILLPDNTILLLDNGRENRKSSRVLQIDPVSKEIVREYQSVPPESFYTKTIGGAQPLPNGNILVTEGRKGRVFELTTDDEIVWQFEHESLQRYQQDATQSTRAGSEKGKKQKLRPKEHFIFRMERYSLDHFTSEIQRSLKKFHARYEH
jgi:hypothetical protein